MVARVLFTPVADWDVLCPQEDLNPSVRRSTKPLPAPDEVLAQGTHSFDPICHLPTRRATWIDQAHLISQIGQGSPKKGPHASVMTRSVVACGRKCRGDRQHEHRCLLILGWKCIQSHYLPHRGRVPVQWQPSWPFKCNQEPSRDS